MTDAAIQILGLEARYDRRRPVLKGLDLIVPRGSVTAVLGTNGVGKSTLIKVLTGELHARAGTVSVLDMDPRRRAVQIKRAVGHVSDHTELPRWMTVTEHQRFLEPFYPTWDRVEADRLTQLFGLDPDARYVELSKGQRALENLVAALAHHPELLLLDEPFSGLDPLVRRKVFEGVLGHLRAEGRTVLVVSHSLVDVERCADRVAILQNGRITLAGDLEQVCARAARVAVTLVPGTTGWAPPGSPVVELEGDEMTLFYLDFGDILRETLESDPAVHSVQLLARDLEDVVVAATERESAA